MPDDVGDENDDQPDDDLVDDDDDGKDASVDRPGRPDVGACTFDAPIALKQLGQSCSCMNECASGFCVDGVCCSGACNALCNACNLPGKAGTCSPIPNGEPPVSAGQCPKEAASTCGFDGLCDGSGACRRYQDGTVCQSGTCDGAAVNGVKVCSKGTCAEGGRTVCSPFACDAQQGMCVSKCTNDNQCADGRKCVNGSCGKKPLGAACSAKTEAEAKEECDSGFCIDGVCCNTGCTGMCQSCNLTGKMGECSAVPVGVQDPRKICKDEGASTCGTSGACDGQGGCAKYAAGTTCKAGSCSGSSQVPAGICDGKGACVVGQAVSCAPFKCVGNSCLKECTADDQCLPPNTCSTVINGKKYCGKKGLGQACVAGAECASNFCVDGVCCNEACGGRCRFCALPSSPGRCVNVGAGVPDPRLARGETDPNRTCMDQGPASCGNNGLCNGSGGCQRYSNTTVCRAASCNATNNQYTPPSLCNGQGTCVTPQAQTCAPYKCNGNRCGFSCSTNNECASPFTCSSNSCGKKPNSQVCGSDAECLSGHCEQGVCCNVACTGTCLRCDLEGSRGTCSAVPAGGVDPTGQCVKSAQATCGTDGTCDGAGGCRRWVKDTPCASASCTSGVTTLASYCDGNGKCVSSGTQNCGDYKCNAEGTACYSSCTPGGAECANMNACLMNGQCGKLAQGQPCTSTGQCASGLMCVDGVCCNSACTGPCKQCNAQGICTNVAAGVADPDDATACAATAQTTCGNDGTCDGSGGCRKWGASTVCRAGACSGDGTKEIPEAKCKGDGTACPAPVEKPCSPYLCSAGACKETCGSNMECASTTFCNLMTLKCVGKKQNGQACQAEDMGSDCESGYCVDGVCCNVGSCASCYSCNVDAMTAGTCAPIPPGQIDMNGGTCVDSGMTCGSTNTCNGAGGCALKTGGCGAECVGDVVTGMSLQGKACSGVSCLASGDPVSCGNNICEVVMGVASCRTKCRTSLDCTKGTTCQDIVDDLGECKMPLPPPGPDGGTDDAAVAP